MKEVFVSWARTAHFVEVSIPCPGLGTVCIAGCHGDLLCLVDPASVYTDEAWFRAGVVFLKDIEGFRMVIEFDPVDVDGDDVMAADAKLHRHGSADKNLGKCFASIRMFDTNDLQVGGIFRSASTPAGSPRLHGERVGLERMITARFLNQGLTQIMINGAQNSPDHVGTELRVRGIKLIECFTELPPCPPCLKWWKTLDSKFDPGIIRIKYYAWFEDYFGNKTPQERLQKGDYDYERNEAAIENFHTYVKGFGAD